MRAASPPLPAGVPPVAIAPTATPEAIAAVAGLFRDYAAALPIDLGYQGFDNEVAGLPGAYALPSGALLLARDKAHRPLGCVGVRPFPGPGEVCEMKRLYVAPAARGLGLGRSLVDAAVATARALGYREIRLDTLPSMAGALHLYAEAGFVETGAYYPTPVAGTRFFALGLAP